MTVRYELTYTDRKGRPRTHAHEGDLSSAASIAGLFAMDHETRVEVVRVAGDKRATVITVEAPSGEKT